MHDVFHATITSSNASLSPSVLTGLKRLMRTADAHQHCELCSAALAADHSHLLGRDDGRIRCACPACSVLFEGAAGRFLRVPRQARIVDHASVADNLWERFGVPIRLAFFGVDTKGALQAIYPSPAGPICAIPEDSAAQILAQHPILADLRPGVEALLVNALDRPAACFIAPIDRCYELVGLVRSSWAGPSGGARLQRQLEQFFASLRAGAAGCQHFRSELARPRRDVQ